jgi:hypothetical protein
LKAEDFETELVIDQGEHFNNFIELVLDALEGTIAEVVDWCRHIAKV